MAQLDLTTYLSQVFWLLILLSSFYVVAFNIFLPKIVTIFKTRNKIIDILREQVSNQDANNSETFIAKTLSVYTNLLTSLSKQNNKNINLLKQALLSNYQHTFFTENVYNSYIVKKNN